MNKLFTQEELHKLSQMRALVDVAKASDTWDDIYERFWQLRVELVEGGNKLLEVDYCDPDTSSKEDILAYWHALWFKLNSFSTGMSKVDYLSDERNQLEEAIGSSFTWSDYSYEDD
jgi:hypothetical protein